MSRAQRRRMVGGAVALVLAVTGCTSGGESVETGGPTGSSTTAGLTTTSTATTTSTVTSVPLSVDAEVLQPWVDEICAALGPWGRRATALGPDDLDRWEGPSGPWQAEAARLYARSVSATADAIEAGLGAADGELEDTAAEVVATLRRSAAEWEEIAEGFDAMRDDYDQDRWDELMSRHLEAEEASLAAFGAFMSVPRQAGIDMGSCGVLLSVIDGSLQPWIDEVCAAAEQWARIPGPIVSLIGEDRTYSERANSARRYAAITSGIADAIEVGLGVTTGEFRQEAESTVATLRRSADGYEEIAEVFDEVPEGDLSSEEWDAVEERTFGVGEEMMEALPRFWVFPHTAGIDAVRCPFMTLGMPICPVDEGPCVESLWHELRRAAGE